MRILLILLLALTLLACGGDARDTDRDDGLDVDEVQ